jgi:hypothetical protein
MGQESEKKPILTMNDPVDAATLKRVGELFTRRHQLGDMMLDIEHEKVKILVESRRVEDERRKLFAHILASRGLDPDTACEIDSETGRLNLLLPQARPAASPPAEEAGSNPLESGGLAGGASGQT